MMEALGQGGVFSKGFKKKIGGVSQAMLGGSRATWSGSAGLIVGFTRIVPSGVPLGSCGARVSILRLPVPHMGFNLLNYLPSPEWGLMVVPQWQKWH